MGLKSYTIDEIVNKHGQYIAYLKDVEGSSDLDKYKNSERPYKKKEREYPIGDKTCIVWYNGGSHREYRGFYLNIYNSLGELIIGTFPGLQLTDNSLESVKEVLEDLL